MSIRCILFDLDGTLLPMDQNSFFHAYFGGLIKKLAPLGFDGETLYQTIWKGTGAMIQNDGSVYNQDRFWDVMHRTYGAKIDEALPYFDDFYANEFALVQQVCGFNPQAAQVVRELKQRGYMVALATQPAFPAVATQSRIRWAGLEAEEFAFVSTFENSKFCKPNPKYYEEIAQTLGVAPKECLMVGNDISDDMPAAQTGMKVFLLADCLIAKEGEDFASYPNGGFDELMAYVASLECC
jgi:FMN phosphatase YigB (HAD superfamily)